MTKAIRRIVSRIEVMDNGCWRWLGCIQSNGYGRVTFERKTMGAHRLSYVAFIGEINKGMDICHRCDNRSCVNPEHLFQGTRKENMEDCVKKGRQARGEKLQHLTGEKCNFSKLKTSDVLTIRQMLLRNVSTKEIAKKFNVSADNIRQIKKRNTWSHI